MTKKQRQIEDRVIIASLLAYGEPALAAEELGLEASAIEKRLGNEDFKKEYAAAAKDIHGAVATKLQFYALAAVNKLADIALYEKNDRKIQTAAAIALLDFYKEFKEDAAKYDSENSETAFFGNYPA